MKRWRVWKDTIVLEGERFVAIFHCAEDAAQVVADHNAAIDGTPIRKAGEVLDTVIAAIPRDREFSVAEILAGVEAPRKEVYNAIGYLARRGRIVRQRYGRYAVAALPEGGARVG